MRTVIAALLLLACADAGEDEGDVRRDALSLQAVLAEDRSPALMAEAERAVGGRKSVHAASLIDNSVLPLVDAQIARARDAELVTVQARKLQLRLVAAYTKRREGLALYRSILATGALETPQVIEALRIQRDAESELLALDQELSELRPNVGARLQAH